VARRGRSGARSRVAALAAEAHRHPNEREPGQRDRVDRVLAEIELPTSEGDWRQATRRQLASARDVLVRHPWAVSLMGSRTNAGPAGLRRARSWPAARTTQRSSTSGSTSSSRRSSVYECGPRSAAEHGDRCQIKGKRAHDGPSSPQRACRSERTGSANRSVDGLRIVALTCDGPPPMLPPWSHRPTRRTCRG
jgi:hypothetical protein